MENNNPKIIVTKNGPYQVSGNLPLDKQYIIPDKNGNPVEWKKGETYPQKGNYSLCRCGHSNNKPYCDGTHEKIKFDGTETAGWEKYADRAEKISGPDLDLTDVPELCASARFCHRAGGTWNLTKKSDNPEAKKAAIEEACNCPSGRLVARDKKTGKPFEKNFEPSLGLIEDPEEGVSGPIWAKGGIPIESENGTPYETRSRATLCRCGKSKNKPFCDGTHIEIRFDDGKIKE